MNIDPLADIQENFTPYHFGYNNPVLYNDPSGLIPGSESVLAICPDCPEGEEYDIYKESEDLYRYEEGVGAFLDIGELVVVGSASYSIHESYFLSSYLSPSRDFFDERANHELRTNEALMATGDLVKDVAAGLSFMTDPVLATEANSSRLVARGASPVFQEIRSIGAAGNKLYNQLVKIAGKASGAKGKQASQLLQKMANKAGLTVKPGGSHLKVFNESGKLVTTIPHSPHAKGTIDGISKAIIEAAGF